DYRNFFEYQGKRYSHTIDVRTGYPVQHNVASVSVIADTAAEADAWATALNVMPLEQIKPLAKAHQLAVFVISRDSAEESVEESVEDDLEGSAKDSDVARITTWYSQQFQAFISE
ncbi:MAG TPA: thiamine biosynthesis protein ApbE, partial [Cellvibrionales bacterium]|nr:thiamine biosynthesis protein ApbE [Cellvibrionales bacterium]